MKAITTISALIIMLPLFADAQNNMNQEVHVVKAYEATISDAYKVNFMPEIADTLPVITKFSYSIEPEMPKIKYEPDQIAPAKVTGEPLSPLFHTYLKAAGGNYTSFLGDAGFNVLRNADYTAAFLYQHRSSSSKIKLANDFKSPASYSDNSFILSGEKFLDAKSLYGNAWFNRDVFHYYGFNTDSLTDFFDTTLVKDNIRQRLMDIGAKIGYKSYFQDSTRLNYDFALGYNFFDDIQNNYQNHITADLQFVNFYKKERLGLNINVNYFNHVSQIDTVNNGIVRLNPHVRFFGSRWRIETGIFLDVDAYSDSLLYHYYPNVFLQYNVIEDLFIPYFGFSGGIVNNDVKMITKENPFIIPGLHIHNTNNLIEINAGFKGRFSRTISFNLWGKYSVIENMYFFLPDSNGIENKFNVVYDNVELMQFRGEFALKTSEKFNVFLTANYYHYQTDSQRYAWHRPIYDATLAFKYNLKNKIIAGLDVYNQSETYSMKWHPAPETISVKSFVDVSLNFEYRYTKYMSFYLLANNITHRKNYHWSYYPSQRLNVMIGASYIF